MKKLERLLKRAKTLSELKAWFGVFDEKTKSIIIDWVKKDQLTAKGVDGDGNVIGHYSYATELITGGKKQEGDHYTLDDTGAFYKSMHVLIFQQSFVILGDGDKGIENLYEKYGNKITTLENENLEKLKIIVRESYRNYVRSVLFGTR